MMPSPLLITGAAGFVGANLTRALLARNLDVHAIVRPSTDGWRLKGLAPSPTLHAVDLRDGASVKAVVRQVKPAAIVHLAKYRGNPHTLDYGGAYATNLDATRHVLEAARDCPPVRVVHAGSSLEYDLSRSPLKEDQESTPLTVHGVTKRAATALCQHYAARHGLPVVVLRLFTVYGPWEDGARFVPRAIMSALDGSPIAVTRSGLVHDWIHVSDVVGAILTALSTDGLEGHVLNVATGRQSTNDDVVAAIARATGRQIRHTADAFPSRPWDAEAWVADVSKTQTLMGWTAAVELQAGLAQTSEWFKQHASLYQASLAGETPT